MKKVLCLLIVLSMALGCVGISASAAEYGMVLNNNVAILVGSTNAVAGNALQTLSTAPVEADGAILVPISAVSTLFNGAVNYDNASGTIDITFGAEKRVVIQVGNKNYTVNGRGYSFSVAPRVESNNVMIPLRDLAEDIIGQTYFYDQGTRLAIISHRAVIKDSFTDAAVISMIASAIQSGNLPEISVPTSYQLDWGVAEETVGGVGVSSGPTPTKVNLTSAMVTASSEPEGANPGSNMVDGSSGTYWATQGPQYAIFDLGASMTVSYVGVQMRVYDDGRSVNYGIDVSADGSNYESVFSGQCVAGGGFMEQVDVNQQARYVRLNVNGSTTNDWASVAEVEVYAIGATNTGAGSGGTTAVTGGTKATITASMINAPTDEAANPPANAVDGNPSTFWAASRGSNMIIDLGAATTVSSVGVRMRQYDDGRTVNYGVSVSTDGSSYTSVYNGACAAGGGVTETHAVGTSARYVRIETNGNSVSDWASVAEVEVYTGGDSAAAASGGSVSYANMSNISGSFMIVAQGTTNAITVGGDNLTLSLAPYTKDSKQIWTKGSNSYGDTVQSSGVGYVMDVSEQSYDPYGAIIVWEGNDGNNQSWSFELDGDGYYIRSVMSGLYLSASGSSIVQLDRGSATKWTVAASDATPVSTGGTVIAGEFQIVVYGTNNALAVQSDNLTLGLASAAFSASQLWTREATGAGDGFKNKASGNYMDVSEQSMDAGGSIIVWEGNGGTNQAWSFEQDGDGFYIRSAMSGLYLSNSGGSIVQLDRSNATKWEIKGDEVETVIPEPTVPTGPAPITSAVEGRFRIAIYGTNDVINLANDGTLKVERNHRLNGQVWTMDSNSHGFIFVNESKGSVLEIPGESTTPGIKIGVWENNDGAHQAWVVEQFGSFCYIKNVATGLYLCYDETGLRQKDFAYATKWIIRPEN